MSSKPETTGDIRAAQVRRALDSAFTAAFMLALVRLFSSAHSWDKINWPDAVLLVAATAGTMAALAQHLPLQNVLWASLLIALGGGAVEWLNAKTQIPFGPVNFGAVGPKILGTVPWAVPLLWTVIVLNARGVARLVLRPWRKTRFYGFRLIGLTAALAMILDVALEPFAVHVKQYWFWEPTRFPLAWQGAPLVNFLSRVVVVLLMLAFISPLLINKQLSKRRGPDFHPLAVSLAALLLFATGSMLHGLWLSASVDLGLGTVIAVFAIRGARW